MNPAVELILFDLDGTLVDLSVEQSLNTALLFLDSLSEDQELVEELLRLYRDYSLFGRVNDGKFKSVLAEIRNYFGPNELFASPRLLPGVKETLSELRSKNKRLGILTGRVVSRDQVRRELKRLGVSGYFDIIETALDDEGSPVEKDEVLSRIEALYGLDPSAIAYIGDSPEGVSQAKHAELGLVVGVLSGVSIKEALFERDADYVLPSVSGLITISEMEH